MRVLENSESDEHLIEVLSRSRDRSRVGDRHPVLVYLSRLAEGSRRAMSQSVELAADVLSSGRADAISLDWTAIRYQHVQAIRAHLVARGYAPATVNRHLSAIRGVVRECWRLGYISAEEYERAADVGAVSGTRLPAGRSLTHVELAALFGACDRSRAAGARDAALLALLYAGLRRAEAVGLDLADYSGEHARLTVRGKGDREREAYLATGAAALIDGWLDFRGPRGGPLLLAVDRGGHVGRRRLSDQAIYQACRRIARRGGVDAFTPHDLRRTWVGDLLDAGADLATVQALAGHATPATTARYDRRPGEVRQQAAALIEVPA